MTTPVTASVKTRKEKVEEIRKYHQPAFEALGIPNAYFDAKSKSVIDPKGKVGFFKSQLEANEDIYFEITGFKQEITDTNRTLYRLRNNPHYQSEDGTYEHRAFTPAGEQFYVAMDEFEIIKAPVFLQDAFEEKENEGDDILADKLTARDVICAQLKVPMSSKEWINELIKYALKSK